MTPALLGKKVGMTRIYNEKGTIVPVTVVEVEPNVITQVKTADGKDGYHAVQLGFKEVKAKYSTFPLIAHSAKAGQGMAIGSGIGAIGDALVIEIQPLIKEIGVGRRRASLRAQGIERQRLGGLVELQVQAGADGRDAAVAAVGLRGARCLLVDDRLDRLSRLNPDDRESFAGAFSRALADARR